MSRLNITTIILTFNEELHIWRCLENVCPFSNKVIVVDSVSNDRTVEICKLFPNVEVVEHAYPGNQAEQFNWAIDNLEISTEWVLRLDADEYLLPDLISELTEKLPLLPSDVTGIEFKRRHIFMEKWVKRGIYPVIIMRMFRNGVGRYDARLMDEHIVLSRGRSVVFENDFCDHSLINISDYCRKHLNYAQREAYEILNELYVLNNSSIVRADKTGKQAEEKHGKKRFYNRLPLFWRSFWYFCYRYVFRLGFLDGKEGFLFAFIQGWWYRTMVDTKVLEALRSCHIPLNSKTISDVQKTGLKDFVTNNWGIIISKS